ncbi:MAG: hypothetical protein J6Z23_06840 [Lachnospiraceae bacterium]|nr:hypothetical protein [Lachnospiraceae bacterium]
MHSDHHVTREARLTGGAFRKAAQRCFALCAAAVLFLTTARLPVYAEGMRASGSSPVPASAETGGGGRTVNAEIIFYNHRYDFREGSAFDPRAFEWFLSGTLPALPGGEFLEVRLLCTPEDVQGMRNLEVFAAGAGPVGTRVTEECVWDAASGTLRIPARYAEETLTVRWYESTASSLYETGVPSAFRFDKAARDTYAPASVLDRFTGGTNDVYGGYRNEALSFQTYDLGDTVSAADDASFSAGSVWTMKAAPYTEDASLRSIGDIPYVTDSGKIGFRDWRGYYAAASSIGMSTLQPLQDSCAWALWAIRFTGVEGDAPAFLKKTGGSGAIGAEGAAYLYRHHFAPAEVFENPYQGPFTAISGRAPYIFVNLGIGYIYAFYDAASDRYVYDPSDPAYGTLFDETGANPVSGSTQRREYVIRNGVAYCIRMGQYVSAGNVNSGRWYNVYRERTAADGTGDAGYDGFQTSGRYLAGFCLGNHPSITGTSAYSAANDNPNYIDAMVKCVGKTETAGVVTAVFYLAVESRMGQDIGSIFAVTYRRTGTVRVRKSFPDLKAWDAGTQSYSGSSLYAGVSLAGFRFVLSGTSDAGEDIFREGVTDADGALDFTDLPYGTYTVRETLTAAQARQFLGMDGAAETFTLSGSAPEFTYALTNVRTGRVVVRKSTDDASDDLSGFRFTLTADRYSAAHGVPDIVYEAVTDSTGTAVFDNIPYGGYYIREELTEEQKKVYRNPDPARFWFELSEMCDAEPGSGVRVFTYALENRRYPSGSVVVTKRFAEDGPACDGLSANGFTFVLSGTDRNGDAYTRTGVTGEGGNRTGPSSSKMCRRAPTPSAKC